LLVCTHAQALAPPSHTLAHMCTCFKLVDLRYPHSLAGACTHMHARTHLQTRTHARTHAQSSYGFFCRTRKSKERGNPPAGSGNQTTDGRRVFTSASVAVHPIPADSLMNSHSSTLVSLSVALEGCQGQAIHLSVLSTWCGVYCTG
jgi:hypothetical protein